MALNSDIVTTLIAEAKAAILAGDFVLAAQKTEAARTEQELHIAYVAGGLDDQKARLEAIKDGLGAINTLARLLG